jgi:hypothetical protein
MCYKLLLLIYLILILNNTTRSDIQWRGELKNFHKQVYFVDTHP